MSIIFSNNKFHIYNKYLSYVIEIGKDNDLLNTYFGSPIDIDNINANYLKSKNWQPYSKVKGENYYLGALPCEYPTALSPDYRAPAFEAETVDGINSFRFKYKGYEIINGKPPLKGLPAVYSEFTDDVKTLKLITVDDKAKIEIDLFYSIFENFSAVCRHTEIINIGVSPIKINNAQSMCLDFPVGKYEYIHLAGDWAREKHICRSDVSLGTHGFESRQGASSSAENPFMLFGDKDMTENYGNVYGISLIYSGNHSFKIDSSTETAPRLLAGINPFMFSYCLNQNENFITPEVVIAYSDNGISEISKTFHRLYRTRLCRGVFKDQSRPILINNWEGTYFDFNRQKLLEIADVASEIGIELFVLDDGWFGKRDNDTCSLGDWFVNEEKLGGTIKSFADEINSRGLKFGLWFEPEMISRDSELYRTHPDWVVNTPEREPFEARNQLVLDFTQIQVRDYIVKTISKILNECNIEYVKWDKNRYITEPYSTSLSPERQGEFMHRYILGLYDVLERITSAFPNVLFESCSGGGARNDPGMLYYMPQTWISDDTDAIERQYIQYGASLAYPVSSWGAHVSAVPNHQTGQITSLSMRGTVAMNGAFGYELDLTKIGEDEKEIMRKQIIFYKENRDLINKADYYRLVSPYCDCYTAWLYVSEDKSNALLYFATAKTIANPSPFRVKLAGLEPLEKYIFDGDIYTGRTLMNYGIFIDPMYQKDFIKTIIKV